MALRNPPKQAPLLALLGQLAESGFLSANQITKVWGTYPMLLPYDITVFFWLCPLNTPWR